MIHHTVGPDISKTHLDAFQRQNGKIAQFPNDAAGFAALTA